MQVYTPPSESFRNIILGHARGASQYAVGTEYCQGYCIKKCKMDETHNIYRENKKSVYILVA